MYIYTLLTCIYLFSMFLIEIIVGFNESKLSQLFRYFINESSR